MREYYVFKSQIHDPDTPTYMEPLSGDNVEEYFKAMYDEIKSLVRRDTWEIFEVSQLLITMFFQEHDPSRAIGNLIGQSVNSRHNIL